jgi:probable HAF family extracellular repeat protein
MKKFRLALITMGALFLLNECGGGGAAANKSGAGGNGGGDVKKPNTVVITSSPPPNGVVGERYGPTFTILENHCLATFTGWQPSATGGSGQYHFTWSGAPGSSLPPGLTISIETFTCGGSTRCCVTVASPPLVNGTPSTAGTYDVIVTVTDSSSPPNQASAAYTIIVSTQSKAVPAAAPASSLGPEHPRYRLVDLGTLGGSQSYLYIPNNYASVLNNQGRVVGYAETPTQDPFQSVGFCFVFPDCLVTNAFETKNGTLQNLGVLPGGASSAAGWISPNGLIAGWSQNGTTDPSFPGFPVTHGVLWKDGNMTDLKTLADGSESVALAVNSSGLVAGAANNSIADPNPMFSDVYGWATQTRAFVWQDGVMKDIGTLGGTDAVAFLINERGQIVGISYTSSTPSAYCAILGASLTTGGFIYEGGEMKNLGSFGGSCTFPTDLNDRGEVVGLSTLEGDVYQHAFLWENDSFDELPNMIGGHNAAAIALNNNGEAAGWASLPGDQAVHASLWKNNSMTDLGTFGEDPCSLGFSINVRGQVVGISGFQQDLSGCNSGNTTRAFLWEDGSMVDLNTLIPPDSPLYLTLADTINDLGEIAGIGVDANGNGHAFLLIPQEGDGNFGEYTTAGAVGARVPKVGDSPASSTRSEAAAGARFRHFIGRHPH